MPTSSHRLILLAWIAASLLSACSRSSGPMRPVGDAAAVAAPAPPPALPPTPREIEPFDRDWRFALADAVNAPGNDTPWRHIDLPHDWSIEGPFDPNNRTGGAGGFLPSGVAWYRKSFTLPPAAAGKRVFVEFDGVMQNSDVWVNGTHLGHRPYGYVSFQYELTQHLRVGPDATNVIVVRCDTAQQPASRWYSGAGIYRHVRLIITDAVHVGHWDTFITTPQVSASAATVRVQTRVENESEAAREAVVRFTLAAPDGRIVATAEAAAQSIAPGHSAAYEQTFTVANPQRWNLTAPQLYRAQVTVLDGDKALDGETVAFGIRDARFDSATGFWLNGKNIKLYGVAVHHDGGAFGAAVPLAVWEQRLAILRTLGVNAIRTAHNPADPGFLDLCDRMGFLVMDELFDCWEVGKNPFDYHLFFDEWSKTDVRDTVRRDRNHPSIVLYSAGNEIHDTPNEARAQEILRGLVATFHEYDPTRPVTQALFRPNVSHDYTNGLADLLDVIGTNYRDQELLAAWRAKPGRKIIGTEQRHDRATWLALRDNAAEAGQFLWTGVDYLGEAPAWPVIGSSSGVIDRTGWVKPLGRERQSWWTSTPMVAITRRTAPNFSSKYDPGYEPNGAQTPVRSRQVLYADWTPGNQRPHEETVEVYSNCESVELFLNGKSLGAKPLNADASARVWKVAYAPGALRAVATNGGRVVAEDEVRTAGAPAAIVLRPAHRAVSAAWEDVDEVNATVVDAQGVPVPTASDLIAFKAEGPGVVVATDNGSNTTHEPFQSKQYHAYEGRCVAFIRATAAAGQIIVTATAPGLKSGEAVIAARP